MTSCALCGDKRKNIRWYVNEKPVCNRHYKSLKRISVIMDMPAKFEERKDGAKHFATQPKWAQTVRIQRKGEAPEYIPANDLAPEQDGEDGEV